MKLKMHLMTFASAAPRLRRPRNAAITAMLAVAAAGPAISNAEVPPVDDVGRPAIVLCEVTLGGEPVRAVHMDKVIFHITDILLAADAGDQAALNAVPRNSRLDIKVLDNPTTVADLKGKVLSFLGAVDGPINRERIVIDDVDYAVVCPNPETSGGAN
jgi:hypothetical protein